jgi:hypothetical protein
MSTTHPRFTARIKGPPEIIFDLIADMPNYGRWLPGSQRMTRVLHPLAGEGRTQVHEPMLRPVRD